MWTYRGEELTGHRGLRCIVERDGQPAAVADVTVISRIAKHAVLVVSYFPVRDAS